MLRIASRMATGKTANSSATAEHAKRLMERQPHVVICDNVAEYVARSDRQEWDNREIPGIVSPWPYALYEWAIPNRNDWNYGGGVDPMSHLDFGGTTEAQQASMFVETLDCRHDPEYLPRMAGKMKSANVAWPQLNFDSIRWVSYFVPFLVGKGVLAELAAFGFHFIGENGEHVENVMISQFDASLNDIIGSVLAQLGTIVLTTISMANCRNVKLVETTESDGPSAKWNRRARAQEVRYHRILIDGLVSHTSKDGGGLAGLKHAWHICRGSFAEYKAEAPLFGKYVGRFWRPQHVKGKKELGEVRSTHEVKI